MACRGVNGARVRSQETLRFRRIQRAKIDAFDFCRSNYEVKEVAAVRQKPWVSVSRLSLRQFGDRHFFASRRGHAVKRPVTGSGKQNYAVTIPGSSIWQGTDIANALRWASSNIHSFQLTRSEKSNRTAVR